MSHTTDRGDGHKANQAVLTHLSALVDGELEPLEAIAVQRHVRGNEAMATEVRELEHVKLAVHLAGIRDGVPANVGARLRQHVGEMADARRVGQRSRRWIAPLLMTASAMAVALVMWPTTAPIDSGSGVAPVELTTTPWASPDAPFELSESTLLRLVSLHRGEITPSELPSARSGALLSVDTMPSSFIRPEGSSNLVLASFEACREQSPGATLARLRADRVSLPGEIMDALENSGVYSEIIEGVEVKLNLNGETLLVKISDPDVEDEAI